MLETRLAAQQQLGPTAEFNPLSTPVTDLHDTSSVSSVPESNPTPLATRSPSVSEPENVPTTITSVSSQAGSLGVHNKETHSIEPVSELMQAEL
jgi:hypothetical protein